MTPIEPQNIDKVAEQTGVPLVRLDGMDACVLGVTADGQHLVYSAPRIIDLLMRRDGMDDEEAQEWFYFNIECAYLGPHTPVYRYEH
jgi:hypothetical protein